MKINHKHNNLKGNDINLFQKIGQKYNIYHV